MDSNTDVAQARRGKKILLVDHSSTVLCIVKRILRDYPLVTAVNGEEGVEKALSERPDLILLDVVMPKLDGFQACRRLRKHESLRDVPILMMTTRGEPNNIERGYESGCTEYITKPFNGAELLARVRNFLGTADGERALFSAGGDLRELEDENLGLRELVTRLDRELANLSSLYAAAQSLGDARTRRDLIGVISAIVADVIGSERFCIFEVDPAGATLGIVASREIEATRFDRIVIGQGRIGMVAHTGQTYAAKTPPSADYDNTTLTACVPLKAFNRVVGVLAIFELLPQRTALEPFDHEVFELLEAHAGRALLWTRDAAAGANDAQ